MAEVVIAGIGQIPVGEHWDLSLRSLAAEATLAAQADAGGIRPQSIYIGNFLASMVSHQSNLGALIADYVGLENAEAYTTEAAGASGAAAFRMGYLAVASGFVNAALVLGVEKYTDMVGPELESAVAQSQDYDYEGVPGLTPTSQAALLMKRYLFENNVPRQAFAEFAVLAHANAASNPNAMFRRPVTREAYEKAEVVADPLNMYDIAPYADGAAAVILTRPELLPEGFPHPLVEVVGSSSAVDSLALHDRHDLLEFAAARTGVEKACRQAGILPGDVDFFELSDAYSVYAALSLEAAGFASRGEGWKLAADCQLGLNDKLPVSTFGGLKGRGNPIGASGVYQVVEAALQLRGQAGPNQVEGARRGMLQSLGGPASTAVTHILQRRDR